MIDSDMDAKRRRNEKVAKVLGLAVVGFFASFVVVKAIVGLAGLLVVIGTSWAAISFLPYVAMKFANWRLKAIKAEAAKNPIESLQNQSAKKHEALAQYLDKLNDFGAQLLAFADKVKAYVRQGLDDAPVYVEQLDKMKQLQQVRQDKYTATKGALAEFDEGIRRASTKWEMAKAAAAMSEVAGDVDGDVFDKIVVETSLDSVQTSLNKSFAELDTLLLDSKPVVTAPRAALAEPHADAIDAQVVDGREKVNVNKKSKL